MKLLKGTPLPDYRNVSRGTTWLRSIIEALDCMDSGEKDAMDQLIKEMLPPLHSRREREPGEEG